MRVEHHQLLLVLLLAAPYADAFTSPIFVPHTSKSNILPANLCPISVTLRRSAVTCDASSASAPISSTESPTDLDGVIQSCLSPDCGGGGGGDVERAEAELRAVLSQYKADGDASSKPSSQAFESVILAWLRKSNSDGSTSAIDVASAATRAEALCDEMELLYQPNGILYRKLINVWCAAAMREEDLDAPPSTMGEQKDVQDADDVDESVEDRRAKSYDRTKKAAQHALEILDRMEQLFIETDTDDMMPGVSQYKSVVNAWRILGTDEAEDVIRRVTKREDEMFSRAGLVPDAFLDKRVRSHRDILDIVLRLDNRELAKRLVHRRYGREVEVKDDGSEVVTDRGYPGVVTSTHNYNIIIDALAKSGKPWAGQQAEAILDFMVDQYQSSKNTHIKPNSVTINSCINAWAASSISDSAIRAEAILDKVAAWRHDGKLDDVNADATSYNSIIKAWSLSKGGSEAVGHAERILERMERDARVTPDEISYSSVINSYAKQSASDSRAADKAEQLLLRMYQEHKLNPEKCVAPTVRCFNAALDAHANSRDRSAGRRALKLLSLMEDMYKIGNSNFLPDVWSYNLAIKALSKGGNRRSATQALELLERMEKWSKDGNERIAPDNVTFNTVINAFARSRSRGSAETAEELYYRMKELERGGKCSVRPDSVTLASVVSAWAVSDDNRSSAKRAMILFENAKESGIDIDTVAYNALLNCLAKSGSKYAPDRAEAVLQEMEYEFARGNTNVKPDVISYTSTISALARSRDKMAPHRAMTILARMEAQAVSAEDDSIRPNALTYTAAIRVWARSRDKNKAQQASNLLNWMEEQYRRGNISARPMETSYNLVLNACAYTAASQDAKTMEEAFKVACLTFQELRTSDFVKPNHISYANFLEVVTKLMPEGELHDKLIGNVFQRCCRDGVVSRPVIRRLRGAGSSDLFKTLLGGERITNLPPAWTRNL